VVLIVLPVVVVPVVPVVVDVGAADVDDVVLLGVVVVVSPVSVVVVVRAVSAETTVKMKVIVGLVRDDWKKQNVQEETLPSLSLPNIILRYLTRPSLQSLGYLT